MGRKTHEVSNAETVNAATAEAARILTADLAAVSAMMRANLKAASEADDYDEQEKLFEDAMRLVDAAARLSEALARVKGELRQTISVERTAGGFERVPKSTEIAPQFAPNKMAMLYLTDPTTNR
jgi:hypothetical protein